MPCWYEISSSSGTTGIPIKEIARKEEQPIQNPTLNATSAKVPSTSSKIALYGKMRREKERQGTQEDYKAKEISTKPTFKAMIAAWGESKSDAETENPKEEETTNLCLMASHESKDEKSKENG